jgi:hypothetical protein
MIQVPLDNLRKTRQYLAEKILSVVQRYYTEERIIMITDENDPMKPREEMVINESTASGDILNDITVGEYDVVVATSPARDSFDEIQFAEALNLRQVGVAIPDDAIVEYSHLERKADLAKRIRTLTGQEPPSPAQQQVMQQQQELQMQQVQLELAKLQAEVQKLQGEAQLSMAKAEEMANIDPQLRMAELQAKVQMKQEELQLRRDLSTATNELRSVQSETQAATNIATTVMKTAKSNTNPPPGE